MSESDGGPPAAPQRYATIVVVGGGCYGGYYVRQLDRAARAGALEAERVVVVDRDPACAVALTLASAERPVGVRVELAVRDWQEYFDEYLLAASERPAEHERDAIVPSPLMPHLMGAWLVARARARWPKRTVSIEPFDRLPSVPWERAGGDGTHYVSFATWTCPINCIEPRICPVTRGPRSWSLPVAIAEFQADEAARGHRVETAVLHCRHRTYGVGMFDTAEVIAADRRIRDAGGRGEADVVIGTVSHCHGALTRLRIAASRAAGRAAGRATSRG